MNERPVIIDIGYIIGGDEGQFLVEKMLDMFTAWAERQGFVYDILDRAPAFGGGLKSAKIGIYCVDRDSFAALHQGAHTMIRIPPNSAKITIYDVDQDNNRIPLGNAEQRRHMSIAGVRISDDPNLPLPQEMADWGEERRRYIFDPDRAVFDAILGRLEIDPDVIFAGDFFALDGVPSKLRRISKMGDLYSYIDLIRTRPGMYIGGIAVTLMFHHVAGYEAACRWAGVDEQLDPPWYDFFEFVRGKTGFEESTSGWANMLLTYNGGDEAKALDMFFLLFDDFRSKTK